MHGFSKLALVAASIVAPLVGASPLSPSLETRQDKPGSFWLGNMNHQGQVFDGTALDTDYKVFRNVQEAPYNAKGDGVTDDTDAIMQAIADGERCGGLTPNTGVKQGVYQAACNSTTTKPAIIYFPAGTYLVKTSINMFYYSQLIGDPNNMPTIKASSDFTGMGVLDSDPYQPDGSNWFINQNNFFRQVRNFILDVSAAPQGQAAIHWQVAQATSLTNLVFKGDKSKGHQGVFMDNGSGLHLSGCSFDGAGAFFGNQQFTSRGLSFKNCNTAITMNWNWLWNLKNITVEPTCDHAVNMSSGGPTAQTVGSIVIQDSKLSPSGDAIITAYTDDQMAANGTLVLDNVDFTGAGGNYVVDLQAKAILPASPDAPKIKSWLQGFAYTTGSTGNATLSTRADGQARVRGAPAAAFRDTLSASGLLNADGSFYEKDRPQYESFTSAQIISAKAEGAKGDGTTDDTKALQAAVNKAAAANVPLFIDHGAYLLTDTLSIPPQSRIVGEIWPIILADGKSFNDVNNPKPVLQVGKAGDTGLVELSDLILTNRGSAQGAIMVEWNIDSKEAGMWDVHTRIGGSAASGQGIKNCARTAAGSPQPETVDECYGVHTMFHLTSSGSGYFENCWWWVADHDLEPTGSSDYQINIYSGRGVLIETQKPSWFSGTASEHSQLYNYAFNGAKNIYMGTLQTETAYMQGGNGPKADAFFKPDLQKYPADPDFSACAADDTSCSMTWGLRFINSESIGIYGAGLYSFFNNYGQQCLKSGGGTDNCQRDMVYFDECSQDISLFALTTKAAVNMVTVGTESAALGASNPSTFGDTVALFEYA